MIGLTQRQSACLQAIEDLTVNGVSPTFDMIGERMGVTSKSVVHRLISALEERGHIRRRRGRPRALELVAPCNRSKTKQQIAANVVNTTFALKKAGKKIGPDELYDIVLEAL